MKKTFIPLLLVLFLTACVTPAKPTIPIEDRKGSEASSGASGDGMSVISSLINDKSLNNNEASNKYNLAAGPANIEKIVYFDHDSYSIKPEFQETIKAHAQFLKANSSTKLSLEGHTDQVITSLEYSLSLGQKRADAVRQSLSLLGVNGTQIETVSFGVEKPAVQGNDEFAFSKNRRVEFFYK